MFVLKTGEKFLLHFQVRRMVPPGGSLGARFQSVPTGSKLPRAGRTMFFDDDKISRVESMSENLENDSRSFQVERFLVFHRFLLFIEYFSDCRSANDWGKIEKLKISANRYVGGKYFKSRRYCRGRHERNLEQCRILLRIARNDIDESSK